MSLAAVMQSEGFKYLSQNYPLLQEELLKTVAECRKPYVRKRKHRSVNPSSDDDDYSSDEDDDDDDDD